LGFAVRIITNLNGLQRAAVRRGGVMVENLNDLPRPPGAVVHQLGRLLRFDYALINCAPRILLRLCALKAVNPWSRCRIVSLDTVLPVPALNGVANRARLAMKRRLFNQVHLFIEYFKDTRGYQRYYRIPASKFRYVPFKVNTERRVRSTPSSDEGYIVCGGNTRRDFATLIAAARRLNYPFRIVTMANAIIREHGSYLDENDLPANVHVVRHDGSESFVDHLAAARLVVLPIKRENISASGIGVYLTAMALGKCVIVSDGPAVHGVLPPGAAVVVPPEDPEALRNAIELAYVDVEHRERHARCGATYARSLGGDEQLCESVLRVLVEDARCEGEPGDPGSQGRSA
jgi:glycosyltransferase involved in cell wall biosynthesis